MKKIFIALIFFIILFGFVNADSGSSSVSWSSNSRKSECGTSFSHGVTHYGVPNQNNASASKSGSSGCTTHTYSGYMYSRAAGGKITACNPGDRVVSGTKRSITCEKYDDTPPKIPDISFINSNTGDDLNLSGIGDGVYLKADNHTIKFNVKTDNPNTNPNKNSANIVKIVTQVENVDNPNSFDSRNYGGVPYTENFNFTKVDNDRGPNNFREFIYRIVDVCDRAGNCLSHNKGLRDGKTIKYNVYANYLDNSKSRITDFNSLDIADGDEKKAIFKLKDKFGNKILPVKKNSGNTLRNLTFKSNYNNDLYLNQYTKSGDSGVDSSGFYEESSTKGTFRPLLIGNNKEVRTIFNDVSVKNSDYVLSIRPYSPTYSSGANDGRQFVDGTFKFIGNTTVKLSDASNLNTLLAGKELQFKPRFYTGITGSLKENGIVVGSRQDSNININKNKPVSFPGDLLLEYGYINLSGGGDKHKVHKNLNLKFNKVIGAAWLPIVSGKQTSDTRLTKFPTSNSKIYTNLIQIGRVDESEQKTYFATHIRDEINGKKPVYSSLVLGMDKYSGNVDHKENTFQRPLKIIGNTHSFYYSEVVKDDTNKNITLLGNLEKSKLQKSVRKKVSDAIRNLDFTTVSSDINLNSLNFSGTTSGKILGDTIYFGNLDGKKLILSGTLRYSGVKNIVAYGGDIYIKNNITAYDKNKDLLSILSIKDSNDKGGNIYIDPGVEKIESTMYADKSLSSYRGNVLSPNNGGTYELLKNQLHIYGSIFSNNTIGGAINVDGSGVSSPICPYYIKTTCSIDEAQKYDLYNLRRGYENILQSDKITLKSGYTNEDKYAFIIEYNPLLQKVGSKFFEIER